MATDTRAETVESCGEHNQHWLLRVLQHVGVYALLVSFEVVYASFIVTVGEIFAQPGVEFPQWFRAVHAAGLGIPVVVTLALAAYYTMSVVSGESPGEWWRYALYAAGGAALVLPVFYYLAPQAVGAF